MDKTEIKQSVPDDTGSKTEADTKYFTKYWRFISVSCCVHFYPRRVRQRLSDRLLSTRWRPNIEGKACQEVSGRVKKRKKAKQKRQQKGPWRESSSLCASRQDTIWGKNEEKLSKIWKRGEGLVVKPPFHTRVRCVGPMFFCSKTLRSCGLWSVCGVPRSDSVIVSGDHSATRRSNSPVSSPH